MWANTILKIILVWELKNTELEIFCSETGSESRLDSVSDTQFWGHRARLQDSQEVDIKILLQFFIKSSTDIDGSFILLVIAILLWKKSTSFIFMFAPICTTVPSTLAVSFLIVSYWLKPPNAFGWEKCSSVRVVIIVK